MRSQRKENQRKVIHLLLIKLIAPYTKSPRNWARYSLHPQISTRNKRSKQSFSISEQGYHMYAKHINIPRVGRVKVVYDREIDERAKYFHATITKTKNK